MSLLEISNLQVAYGGIQAVKGIDLRIDMGETVALIGANGAGKTTTPKTIAGLLKPSGGQLNYAGLDLQRMASHQLIGKGLALVPEGRGIFPRLSVTENLQMGAYHRNDKADIAADLDKMFGLFPRLKERHAQLAGTLSGGEQQMVAIARALMGRPKLLLLDEPSMGLAPILVEEVFRIIQRLKTEGVTMLLVEQFAAAALNVADYGYVLENGSISVHGPAESLKTDPKVIAAYLGGGH